MTPGQRQWIKKFGQAIGGFPKNYLILDTETCGLSLGDPVWDLGFVVVRDGQIIAQGDAQLNIAYGRTELDELRNRFEKTRETLLQHGADWQTITWDWLCSHGKNPTETYSDFYNLIKEAVQNDVLIVGHHIIEFDMPRWQRGFVEACGITTSPLRIENVLDTQYMIAGMLQDSAVPGSRQLLGEWNLAMRGKHRARKYGSSSQEATLGYCDMVDAHRHRALSDSQQLHQVLEYCRNVAEAE